MACLDLDERCCDQKELARHVDIELLHLVEERQVLVDDPDEAQLRDRELVRRDQLEEQVERPLEHACLDFKCHRATCYCA